MKLDISGMITMIGEVLKSDLIDEADIVTLTDIRERMQNLQCMEQEVEKKKQSVSDLLLDLHCSTASPKIGSC